ncbi:MAG TPA: M56 family metallopeptidase, partial [Tepidisphaeraceae bacterium]|nr:M56 family metallopeptidase [Tepidisphaeraceae bacterium]
MNAAEIAERLGLTLLHTLWEGTAVALLLALALLALRRAAANVRYLAACAGLLATLAAAIATFCILSAGDAAIAPQLDLTSPPIPHRAAAIIPIASPPIALDHGNPVPPQVPLSEKIRPYLPALTLFWLAGVLLVSLYRIGGWIYLRRIVALAKPQTEWIGLLSRLCEKLHVARPVRLLYSARIDVPMVTGWLRPAILLPVAAMSGLSVDDVRAILAHELAHIRRHDYLVNLIQTAIETLLFYHPATWWIARQIRRERENCCDDVASAAIGSKLVYARALAELEEQRHLETMAMAANGSPLLPRIRRLLGVRQSTSRPGVGSMIALVAVVALLLSPLVIHQSHAANTTSPPAGNVSITIRCTDGAGKPVAGASVYFAQIVYTNDNSKVTRLGPIVSDANGQVRVHVPPFGRFSSIRQVVYARVPGQWVGSGDKYIEPDLPGAQGDPAAPINVNLSPSVTIRGKVYVPTGIDPSKVTITTTAVNYAGHDFAASFLWPDTPPSDHWLVNIFNAHPESDGSFQLPDAPVNGNTYLVADGPGVGEAQVIVSGQRPASSTLITATPDDVAINMQPEAVVAGIALAPDGKPLANATVVLQAIGNELSNNDPFTGTTGRDGRYRIAGLPALPMSVQLQDAPNCVMATQSVLLQAG